MPQNVLDYAKFKEVLEKPDTHVPVIKVKLYTTHCTCTLTQATRRFWDHVLLD